MLSTCDDAVQNCKQIVMHCTSIVCVYAWLYVSVHGIHTNNMP